ncbi:MAG: arginine-tRNA-protein transferase [Bacteroidota bacterium]
MFTHIHQLKRLAPEQLDRYLDKGWFRMGQMIFTCHFLCFSDRLFTAVWIRLALEEYEFSKSLRKLLRKNNQRFRTIVRKAVFDREKEELYQLHAHRFQGYVADSLVDSLFGDSDYDIYDTYEVCVYDEDKLVAASFFDKGRNSLASIMGLYHPSYAKHSLGFYSMLVEIVFGKSHGMAYYYPGYVVPGYSSFDYKLRIGNVDFYDYDIQDWRPYDQMLIENLPSEKLIYALKAAAEVLDAKKISTRLLLYPLYDKQLFGLEPEESVRYPLFLSCHHEQNSTSMLIIEYDLFARQYKLSEVSLVEDASLFAYQIFSEFDPRKSCLNFLVRDQLILESKNIYLLSEALIRYRKMTTER